MKVIATILFLTLGLTTFAQEESRTISADQIKEMTKRDIMKHGPDVVPELKIRKCYAAPENWYWQYALKQPTHVEELPNGTMALSKELPFVHTLRGATYTYDHLRYLVR